MKEDRREAFEALCRAEYAAVVRTAWLITGDREEAVDLAQESFTRAYERWREVERLDRPGAWLQRVAANLALSWRRRQRVQRRTLAARSRLSAAGPPEAVDPDLTAALRALTPAQRAVVVLRFYADQSVEQTARALGKRPGTVRALSSQGIERLRRSITREPEEEPDALRT